MQTVPSEELDLAVALAVQAINQGGDYRAKSGRAQGIIFIDADGRPAGMVRARADGEWDCGTVKGRGVRNSVYVDLYNAGFPVGEHNY